MPNLNFIALPSHTKLILTIHDLSFVHFPEHYSLKSRLWHRAVSLSALLKRADHVIVVSEHTKGDLMETYGVAAEKINVIYPGVSAIGYSLLDISRSNRVLPKAAQIANSKYLLYFGALEPRKNIEGLIAAYESLMESMRKHGQSASLSAGLQLIIAGLATPYAKYLKKRIGKSQQRDIIKLIENPTEKEKHTLYAGATLFVYPSFYEGFGFPPLEAMTHGVPVVASSVSSIPEICCDAAVLVNPWKTEEIKESMRVLLEDEELRRKYTERGKARVAQFSWPTCAKQVLQLFSYIRKSS